MNIAFFDFDGTITRKDTLIEFIRFMVGDIKFIIGMTFLSPLLIAFKLKLVRNDKAKEKVIVYFFRDMDEIEFQEKAKEFSLKYIDPLVRQDALSCLEWHQNQGDKIVIVSASLQCWLKPWCNKNEFDLISTRLEVLDGKITGKFKTKNCHGQEKVNRIYEEYDLNSFSEIYAYGDSSGDKEMLDLADHEFFQYFKE